MRGQVSYSPLFLLCLSLTLETNLVNVNCLADRRLQASAVRAEASGGTTRGGQHKAHRLLARVQRRRDQEHRQHAACSIRRR